MGVYRVQKVHVGKDHIMYDWCDRNSAGANNLANACRFRQRQMITARRKQLSELSENEQQVFEEYKKAFDVTSIQETASKSSWRDFELLMKINENPDILNKDMSAQTKQEVLKQTVLDMKSNRMEYLDWKEHPEKYEKRPDLPGYKKKGGRCTFTVTNQDCTIKADKKGMLFAAMPYAKDKPFPIGRPSGTLKEVKVCPSNGEYDICFYFEQEWEELEPDPVHQRMIGIDLGVDNLMAVTNNCGLPCLLYKGTILKSVNQYFNKNLARIRSEEMTKPDCPKTKDGIAKFVPTEESMSLSRKRDARIHDFMHKVAKHLIRWCVENRIDTIVVGVNRDWKQRSSIGKTNNQNFVSIPHAYLRKCLDYLAKAEGIHYIEREESYTSRSSFLDRDPIPVYGEDGADKVVFSGKRGPTEYKGMYRKNGFHGLYQAADGTIINADLNGSANILRKEFPDAFEKGDTVDFGSVIIITYPDRKADYENHQKQIMSSNQKHTVISRSAAKRLCRKLA